MSLRLNLEDGVYFLVVLLVLFLVGLVLLALLPKEQKPTIPFVDGISIPYAPPED